MKICPWCGHPLDHKSICPNCGHEEQGRKIMSTEKYETIELNGEKYIKVNNQWLDSSFIIPPTSILREIIKNELQQIDIDGLSVWQLKKYIEEIKNAECYDICLTLTNKILQMAFISKDIETVKVYLSVKCSCLRSLNMAKEVVDLCKEMKAEYGDGILNVATLTSLAAAYCDLDDWAKARQTCNYAYKKQGGGVGYNNELSMVYKRIDANSKK